MNFRSFYLFLVLTLHGFTKQLQAAPVDLNLISSVMKKSVKSGINRIDGQFKTLEQMFAVITLLRIALEITSSLAFFNLSKRQNEKLTTLAREQFRADVIEKHHPKIPNDITLSVKEFLGDKSTLIKDFKNERVDLIIEIESTKILYSPNALQSIPFLNHYSSLYEELGTFKSILFIIATKLLNYLTKNENYNLSRASKVLKIIFYTYLSIKTPSMRNSLKLNMALDFLWYFISAKFNIQVSRC